MPLQNYKRIICGLLSGIALAVGISFACEVICELFLGQLLGFFTTDSTVVEVGIPFTRIFIISCVIESVMFSCFGMLTGADYTNITMSCAMVSSFIVRYSFAWILSVRAGMGFNGIVGTFVIAPCSSLIIAGLFIVSGGGNNRE